MLHLTKLAVGVRDITHLREVQAARAASLPPLRHRTRNAPRRAAEVLDGGSLYWVIAGATVVRQPLRDIIEDRWDDGSPCAGLILDPELVPVLARPTKAFQGWRYLAASDAPADLAATQAAAGADLLPPHLLRDLRELCLI